MNEDEERVYPRLLMLSEFDGEIEGRLKFHKSLYQYRQAELRENEWAFRREEHGPLDPGFSSKMQSYEDMDLADVKEDEEPHGFWLTEKGQRFVTGLRNGLSKLDEGFEERQGAISEIASRNMERTGKEIEEDEEIQDAKKDPYQADV